MSDELKIAEIVPLTGANESNGIALSDGVRLYIDWLNRHGGVHGTRVQLILKDDAYEPDNTVRIAKELSADPQLLLFLGIIGSANNEALIKAGVLEDGKIALLAPRTGDSALYGQPNVFTIRASYHEEIKRIVKQLSATGYTQLSLAYQDDGFGKDALNGMQLALQSSSMLLNEAVPFARNGDAVDVVAAKLAKSSPQVVILAGVTGPAGRFLQAFRARGGTSQVICMSAVDINTLVSTIGADAARGVWVSVVMPSPTRTTSPIVREMLAVRAEMAQSTAINFNSLEGFITAKIAVEALQRAGNQPTRKSVLKVLEELPPIEIGGMLVDLHRRNTAQRYVDLVVVGPNGAILQ